MLKIKGFSKIYMLCNMFWKTSICPLEVQPFYKKSNLILQISFLKFSRFKNDEVDPFLNIPHANANLPKIGLKCDIFIVTC